MISIPSQHAQIDLHCHSTASDGFLPPAELVAHAAAHNIALLALTDHDTVAGLSAARDAAQRFGMGFINGVEISVSWENKTLHVVGLDIDPHNPALNNLLEDIQQRRLNRAERMAERLDKLGANNSLTAARTLAGDGQLTRTHFARVVVAQGLADDLKQAFKKYLGAGKPAAVRINWPPLSEAIETIHASGGLAVLAHPLRYKLSGAWRQRMLDAFQACGGDAVEVSAGASQNAQDLALITREVASRELLGSIGSDFHAHEQRWIRYGKLAPISTRITPVWRHFNSA